MDTNTNGSTTMNATTSMYHGVDLDDVKAVGRAIKASLKARGVLASVRKGTGTVSQWLSIEAASDTPENRQALGAAMGKHGSYSLNVPASNAHRREYLDRAAGRAFTVAECYWD